MKYDCKKCGECCRKSENIPPDLKDENGVCKHLTKDNLCAIYKERPLVCNLDKFYDYMAARYNMTETKEEFFKRNKKYCKEGV